MLYCEEGRRTRKGKGENVQWDSGRRYFEERFEEMVEVFVVYS
jgi:hypothetical protein